MNGRKIPATADPAAGVYRFIRGQHDERGDFIALRCLRQQVRPDGIVLRRRNRIPFHQRHLFEGGRMDDDFGFSFFK